MTKDKKYGHINRGKRADLKDIFFRSGWEANWARYLTFLQEKGEIIAWQYEPETFEFEKIKKGNKYYTPDFRIINNDGSVVYHEVKGYMTPQARTKLNRMRRYYPGVEVIVITRRDYMKVANQLGPLLKNWEGYPYSK